MPKKVREDNHRSRDKMQKSLTKSQSKKICLYYLIKKNDKGSVNCNTCQELLTQTQKLCWMNQQPIESQN